MGGPHAFLSGYFYLRRDPQVLAAQKPRGVDRTGDVLLETRRRLQQLMANQKTDAGWEGYRGEFGGDRLCTGEKTVVREATQTKTETSSTLVLGTFLKRNDFVCSSVNKWIHRIIPVR